MLKLKWKDIEKYQFVMPEEVSRDYFTDYIIDENHVFSIDEKDLIKWKEKLNK